VSICALREPHVLLAELFLRLASAECIFLIDSMTVVNPGAVHVHLCAQVVDLGAVLRGADTALQRPNAPVTITTQIHE